MVDNFFQQFMLNHYDGPAFLVGQDKCVLTWNRAFETVFSRVNLKNPMKLADIFNDENKLQQWETFFNDTIKEGHGKMVYDFLIGENQQIYEFRSYRLEENNKSQVFFLAMDITQNDDFERKLAEQNIKLKKINEELDNFVYSVSHQIRSPLSSLLGLINVAKIDTSSKVNDYLELMQHSIENLDHTVHEINDYSKNARLDIKIESVDFHDIWEKTIRDFDYGNRLSSFKIIKSIENCEEFHSDQSRINVIISNLLSNAIKFNDLEKNEPTIKVSIKANKEKVKISVQDNGEGMDESVLPKIFDMFYRATRSARGAGLGLYIVKEIVNKLQGKINVSSTSGKGSTFTVELPNLENSES